jgi:hypothetical protein
MGRRRRRRPSRGVRFLSDRGHRKSFCVVSIVIQSGGRTRAAALKGPLQLRASAGIQRNVVQHRYESQLLIIFSDSSDAYSCC